MDNHLVVVLPITAEKLRVMKMMKRKILVSIGVPAYNEEANIKNLLESLLVQKEEGYKLKEIIVVSDGSSDKTVDEIKRVKDKRIRVIEKKQRQGQALCQNEIFERASSDFVVLLNADISIKSDDFFASMVETFKAGKNVGIVASDVKPLSSYSYIGKVLEWHKIWKRKLYENINELDNVRLCHGRARGFSRQAYTNIRWPQVGPEDAYSYLAIKKLGLGFVYCKEAVAYYRSPQTLKDHTRQSVRFLLAEKALSSYFSKQELRKAYAIPKKLFISSAFLGFITNPVKAVPYLVIYSYCRLLALSVKKDDEFTLWESSKSTKILRTEMDNLN